MTDLLAAYVLGTAALSGALAWSKTPADGDWPAWVATSIVIGASWPVTVPVAMAAWAAGWMAGR